MSFSDQKVSGNPDSQQNIEADMPIFVVSDILVDGLQEPVWPHLISTYLILILTLMSFQ